MLTIVTPHRGYNEERNFLGRKTSNYQVIRKKDIYVYLFALEYRLFKRTNKDFQQCYNDFGLIKADLVHLWNGVSQAKKSWISTLEMPDNYSKHKFLNPRKYWTKENCKKIIFLSEWAKREQFKTWEDVYSKHEIEKLYNKSIILPPPQKNYPYSEKNQNDKQVKFIFTGTDFFRKGGFELLKSFDFLLSKGANIHLTIISSLSTSDFPLETTPQNIDFVLKIIKKYPNNIIHYKYLPNNKVVSLMRDSHIFCFPTYLDTYGYVGLEAMSVGTPVISTNQRAIVEYNNNEIGWVIDMPLNASSTIERSTLETKQQMSDLLTDKLIQVLEQIIKDDFNKIIERSKLCYAYIKENHDWDTHSQKLEDIYTEAIQSNVL